MNSEHIRGDDRIKFICTHERKFKFVMWLCVLFQKRVRVFHRVSKREKHLKPRGRRPSGFIVFERLESR